VPEAVLAPRRRLLRERAAELLAAGLLLAMAANLISVIARKSITIDETIAIPSGYYYLTKGAFNLNSEHPPLPKMLAALPLLFLSLEAPAPDAAPSSNSSQRTVTSAHRFWESNRAHFREIFFGSRMPMVLITLLLGALVFIYARWLFGARAAVLAVALYSIEPNILAHGRIIKDIHAAFAYLLFFVALHIYAVAPTLRRAVFLGAAAGLALAMKFSMALVVPVFLIGAIALIACAPRRGQKRRMILTQLVAVACIALFVINASYLFRHQPLTSADVVWIGQAAPGNAPSLLAVINAASVLFPPYFLFGIVSGLARNAGDHQLFLLGMYSTKGWWYYFPVVFALKTTVPFFLLTLASLAWAVGSAIRRETRLLVLVAAVVVYAFAAMLTRVNIGIRHFLPVFPFLFILAGALLDHVIRMRRRNLALGVVAMLLAWMSFETIRAYPDYVSYMSQITLRRPPWRCLSDSNVEWGDDSGALAEYLQARGEGRVRAALLGGSVLLPLYGVEYVDLLSPPGTILPETRYVALGASFLNGSTVPGWSAGSGRETKEQQRDYFASYRDRTPEAIIGSIYLYRVQ
jgi:Dolichyl-phosphate-mannose-protein mannosyltransferase